MMKQHLLFAVALLTTLSLFSQPVLQNNVVPNIGDKASLNTADTLHIEVGNAGANQTWDFSNLHLEAGTTPLLYEYLAPGVTPYTAQFPTANLVLKINEDTAIYVYSRKDNTQFVLLGSASLTFLQKYTNPDLNLQTPLNFNGSFQDNFAYNTESDGSFIFYTTGSRTATYDAYGTLKTPLGTFPNAIRVRYTSTQVDSASQSGLFEFVNHTDLTTYDWFVAGHPGPLASIYYTHIISETRIPGFDTLITETPRFKSVNYVSTSTTGTFNAPDAPAGLTITALGPNPASDEIRLQFSLESGNRQLTLLLTDVAGRVVKTQTLQPAAGTNDYVISVGELAAGTYQLTLLDGQQVISRSWVKE